MLLAYICSPRASLPEAGEHSSVTKPKLSGECSSGILPVLIVGFIPLWPCLCAQQASLPGGVTCYAWSASMALSSHQS